MPAEPPLPPIPDGGLADTMPSWLRPSRSNAASAASALDRSASSGPASEFSTILTDDDLPEWLRRFGDKPERAYGSDEPASSVAPPASPPPPAEEIPEQAASRRVHIGSSPAPASASMPLHPGPDLETIPTRSRLVPWGVGAIVLAAAIVAIVLAFG